MPSTLLQKIIARASNLESVIPGDIVTCQVDLAMLLDSGGPRRIWPRLKELGVGVWDPEKIVLMTDHFVPAVDAESAAILKLTRDFAKEFKIKNFFDMQGIGHIVLAEQGFLEPGMFACGGDSHSTNGGAFACYMSGFGAIEMTGLVVTGEIWLQVPETIRVNWNGKLQQGITAKDISLRLCRALGMDNAFRAIEFGGTTVEEMAMPERMVLTNMATELGAETGLIEADEVTLQAIKNAGKEPKKDFLKWKSDADSMYLASHDFDATSLKPQVAAPHKPSNSGDINDFSNVSIDQAYIGACVGAKLSDLHMVAEILKGRKVASNTRLLVAPASKQVMSLAAADGTLAAIVGAGANLLSTGCGACAALGAGILAEDEVCISSTNRNFQGRMGANSSKVYLGSPYTVAASAVAGRITDPREMLLE
ncbi:MAG: 3-isopropylmalate dehydratase large subunit [Pseudomonadota bacterium]|nr:3-isopropylmalate dehydratase large subunit [Pseudomonadota bacterium]